MIVKGPIKAFSSIGTQEAHNIQPLFFGQGEWPLSGYLAGKERGGYCVRALEDEWCETFGVKHAIACNSATSGLMAAAFAVGLQPGDEFICPAMTMSATAAAPMFTGAAPDFCDVGDDDFAIDVPHPIKDTVKAVFLTNLFGHPSRLNLWKEIAVSNDIPLIEDNAQSPLAMERGQYTGTVGDIGIFSMNVHKHFQCGEGGVCTTDNDELAFRLRAIINHAEHVSDYVGLNLRMNEVTAAIALVQLRRGKEIIAGRVEQAEAIIAAIGDIPGLRPPMVRDGCTNVYYTIPFLVEKNRAEFCAALREEGVPVVEGYVPPLYRMPVFSQFARPCPVAEDLHDRRLFYIENCAWSFTPEQIRQVGEAFKRAAEKWL